MCPSESRSGSAGRSSALESRRVTRSPWSMRRTRRSRSRRLPHGNHLRLHPLRGHHPARPPGVQHHQAHGATGNRIASGAAHQGTGEGVLPFRPRDGDRHAHCARLHDGQRGKKLVISPYTVNTHVRHVYEKIGIHKRSELIDYINGNGSSESGN